MRFVGVVLVPCEGEEESCGIDRRSCEVEELGMAASGII